MIATSIPSTRRRVEPASHWPVLLRNDRIAHIRALRLDDVQRERAFLARLSPEYRACQFLGLVHGADEDVARELIDADPTREVVLGAFIGEGRREVEIGVARYLASADGAHCDCTVTVDPAWQKLGVGRSLMHRLIAIARMRGVRRMYAADAARCVGAHGLAERLGFHPRPDPEDPLVTTFELILGN